MPEPGTGEQSQFDILPIGARNALQVVRDLHAVNRVHQGAILRASLDKPMANPLTPGNSEYHEITDGGLNDYLRRNLRGRVLDIGFGGIPELAGIVPNGQVVYLDQDKFDMPGSIQGDAAHLRFANGEFDSAYSRNSVSVDPELLLPEAIRVVRRDGGVVILNTLVATSQGTEMHTIAMVETLKRLGIDIEAQCAFDTLNSVKRHESLALEWNFPSLLTRIQL